MVFEIIHQLFTSSENLLKEYSEEFEKYDSIKNFNKLNKLLDYIKANKNIKEFYDISEKYYHETEEYYPIYEEKIINKIPFFKSARQILNVKLQYLITSNKIEFNDYNNLKAITYLIFINYKKYNPEKTPEEIINKCAKSNYIPKLTQQDLKNQNIPNITDIENTLIKIKNTKFENYEIEKFNKDILNYMTVYLKGGLCSSTFYNHVKFSPHYLMACSAVKNNRYITYEDVIQGYLQTFKIFCEDLTQEIEKYYEEN